MSSTETDNNTEDKYITLQKLEESFGILKPEEQTLKSNNEEDQKDIHHEFMMMDNSKEIYSEEMEKEFNDLIWKKLKLLDEVQNDNVNVKMEEDLNENPLELEPQISTERRPLKIRYTRQYLLDHKNDPLSMEFPDCLLKYLCSGEVPLREEESYDSRRMDHILFYTSLPYTRMRSSLNACAKRSPFNLCY